MTFYDFLGKFGPGTLFWLPLIHNESDLPQSWVWCIAAVIGFFLTGIILDSAVRLVTRPLSLNKCMLTKSRKELYGKIITESLPPTLQADPPDIKISYFKAYYRVQTGKLLGNVPVLEAQENFLKSIWFILLIYMSVIIFDKFPSAFTIPSAITFAIFFAIIAIPFVWYKIQMKIYELIWDAELYLISQNATDHDDKNTRNI